MKIKAQLQEANFQLAQEECVIEKTIYLSQTNFLMFMSNYNRPQQFIRDNLDTMNIDDDSVYHCLLVRNELTNEGIVVFSDEAFAKKTAYIEDVSVFDNRQLPKALAQFVDTMMKVQSGIVQKVLDDNDQGTLNLSRDYIEENLAEGYPINMYMLKEMLMECDEIESINLDSDNLAIKCDERFANYPYSRLDESDYDQLEIMAAKHTLWTYDEGGEQFNLEGVHAENMSFVGKCLNGAIIKNCSFKNCDFTDAEFCSADLSGTSFENCKLIHVTAEEADLSSSLFDNCEISGSIFTHANFAEATIHLCDMHKLSFASCCVEDISIFGDTGSDLDFSNVYRSRDEYETSNNPNLTMGDE